MSADTVRDLWVLAGAGVLLLVISAAHDLLTRHLFTDPNLTRDDLEEYAP